MRFIASIGCVTDYVKDSSWLEARRLENVKNKMKFGRKLSYDEKAFLKVRDPELYEKVVKIEEERAAFRRELANCKTKQEALMVRTTKSVELRTEVKNKSNSEYITMRMMAVLDEFSDFAKNIGG